MFWGNKSGKDKQAGKKAPGSKTKNQKPGKNQKKDVGTTGKSQQLRQEALAHARAAREALGEDTIARIAAAMHKKQNSPLEKAKADITGADTDKVIDELLWMLEDKR